MKWKVGDRLIIRYHKDINILGTITKIVTSSKIAEVDLDTNDRDSFVMGELNTIKDGLILGKSIYKRRRNDTIKDEAVFKFLNIPLDEKEYLKLKNKVPFSILERRKKREKLYFTIRKQCAPFIKEFGKTYLNYKYIYRGIKGAEKYKDNIILINVRLKAGSIMLF